MKFFRRHLLFRLVLTLTISAAMILSPLPLAGVFAGPAGDEPEQYTTIDEFRTAGDAPWFRATAVCDLVRGRHGKLNTYSFTPKGFSFVGAGIPLVAAALEKNIQPTVLMRNPDDETLSVPAGRGLFVEEVNAIVRRIPPQSRLKPGEWETEFTLASRELTGLAGATEKYKVSFSAEHVRFGNEQLFLVIYRGATGKIESEKGFSFDLSFRGFFLMDADGTSTYYAVFRYEGDVSAGDKKHGFAGQQYIYRNRPKDGAAVVPPAQVEGLRALVNGYPFLTMGEKIPETPGDAETPEWFGAVWGASRDVSVSTAAGAEGKTNLAPIVAIWIGAHVIDGVYTLGANIVHDVRSNWRGDKNANFNPFDGNVSSPLSTYIYKPAARNLIVKPLAWFGAIDPNNIETYTEKAGFILKLPGDIATMLVNPQNLLGAAAGASRFTNYVNLIVGKLMNLNNYVLGVGDRWKWMPNVITTTGILGDGYSAYAAGPDAPADAPADIDRRIRELTGKWADPNLPREEKDRIWEQLRDLRRQQSPPGGPGTASGGPPQPQTPRDRQDAGQKRRRAAELDEQILELSKKYADPRTKNRKAILEQIRQLEAERNRIVSETE